jgi:succinate dehydrogenase/fumarate reductase cytochrome b subunit
MRALILCTLVVLFTCGIVAAVVFHGAARVMLAAPDVPQAEAVAASAALDLFAVLGLVAAVVLLGVDRVRRW